MAKNDTAPEVVSALLMAKISAGIEKVKNESSVAELQSAVTVAGIDKLKKFKCNHCDQFETDSNTIFLEHVLQCSATVAAAAVAAAAAAAAAKKDTEENDSKGILQLHTQPQQQQQQLPDKEEQRSSNSQQNSRKLFECDVCLMKFSNGANMRRHKMRHTGVKPYECRVCQKRFFRKDHLAEHFTTHTKTLPYHCPICNRGFQRQIAMRAHFQNEHVGQHDLVKTCPLCSFRAGTMKSLRVHFFNRHGIDLDNPGSSASSSLLLALNPSQSNMYCLPTTSLTRTTPTTVVTPSYSDSGESLRSTENATPPLHFLTPHVEISMTESVDTSKQPINIQKQESNDSSALPPFVDSNSNISTSSSKSINLEKQLRKNFQIEDTITPSISLIPIKQEQDNDEYNNNSNNNNNNISNINNNIHRNDDQNISDLSKESTDSINNRNTTQSTIKVSPLKSLLREDLKRRLNAKANSIAVRNFSTTATAAVASVNNNTITLNNNNTMDKPILPPEMISCNNIGTSNGVITSSEQEIDMTSGLGRNLQCLFCKIEFPDQTLYFLHKGCHSESNPWKCNICGEQCGGVYEFNSHLLSKSHQ